MVEKLSHHIECHNQEDINRNKNINAYLFAALNLTVRLPEQGLLFLQRHRAKRSAKDKTQFHMDCFIGAQSYFCPAKTHQSF